MMFMPLFDQDGAVADPVAEVGFYCVRCGAYLEIDSQYAGKSCECPRCSHVIPVPAMKGDRDGLVGNRHPDILAVEIEFLCPECRRKLSVQAGAGAMADCAWCGRQIEVPQLFSLAGQAPRMLQKTPPDGTPASASTQTPTRPALLTQEELDFLSEPEAPGDSHNPTAARDK